MIANIEPNEIDKTSEIPRGIIGSIIPCFNTCTWSCSCMLEIICSEKPMHSMELRDGYQNKPKIGVDTDEEARNDDDAECFNEGPIITFLPTLGNVANHLGDQYAKSLNWMKEIPDDVVVMTSETIGTSFVFWAVIVLVVVSNV